MYINYPGQGMFSISTALNGDAKYRLGLLDGDVEVSVVVGHDARCPRLVEDRLVAQPLHGLVPSDAPSLLQQRTTILLHVKTPR